MRILMLTTVNKIYRKEIYIILSKCIDNHTICLCISIFYIAQLEHSAWFSGTVIGFECDENTESEEVVELTKQLCNQLADFENTMVEYRKELSK